MKQDRFGGFRCDRAEKVADDGADVEADGDFDYGLDLKFDPDDHLREAERVGLRLLLVLEHWQLRGALEPLHLPSAPI